MLHLQVISPGAKWNRLFNCLEYLDRPALYSLSKALSGTLFWKPINSSAPTFQQCSERLPPMIEKISSCSSDTDLRIYKNIIQDETTKNLHVSILQNFRPTTKIHQSTKTYSNTIYKINLFNVIYFPSHERELIHQEKLTILKPINRYHILELLFSIFHIIIRIYI